MAHSGPARPQPWLAWPLAALAAVFWLGVVGVIQPSGVVEAAAMITIALIVGLVAVIAALGASEAGRRAVPVRADRRPQARSRMWEAGCSRPPAAPSPRRRELLPLAHSRYGALP